MSYKSAHAFRDWKIDEVVIRRKGALTDVLGGVIEIESDTDIANVYSELRLLAAAGCPADTERGNPNFQRWRKYTPPKWGVAYMVHVLKATPGRFRIYFYVHSQKEQQIVILYVVGKKTNKRDPKDFEKCCRILDKLAAHTAEIQQVDIPPG